MSFSLPFPRPGPERRRAAGLAAGLERAATTVAVGYGGSYFFRRALRSLRHGIAHFDIPVAIGIAAAYGGSLWAFAEGRSDALYLDSVNVFLYVHAARPRFLQERTLLVNRRRLLRSEAFSLCLRDGAGGAAARGAVGGRPARHAAAPPAGRPVPGRGDAPLGARMRVRSGVADGESRPPSRRASRCGRARGCSAPGRRASTHAPGSTRPRSRRCAQARAKELPVLWRWSVQVYVFVVLAAALAGLIAWWGRWTRTARRRCSSPCWS
ncbi:MAG: hypothetical protein U0470_02625 [Anaerolineae bacterium]